MSAKYANDASVKILSIEDLDMNAKYPDIEQSASQTGKVIRSHYVGESDPYYGGGKRKEPHMYYTFI